MEGLFTSIKVEITAHQYNKYDYFNCMDKRWFELKKAFDEAKAALKEREQFLQGLTSETEIDGLIVYPPQMKIETSYKINPIK